MQGVSQPICLTTSFSLHRVKEEGDGDGDNCGVGSAQRSKRRKTMDASSMEAKLFCMEAKLDALVNEISLMKNNLFQLAMKMTTSKD